MRVVLASDRTQVQNLLMDVVEEEPGAVVIGQAENAPKALGLVRNLRPDVAIIDSELPYSVGIDAVPLSRMSGLDIAQAICESAPWTRVVVINNLGTELLPKIGSGRDSRAFFSREGRGGNTAFKLQQLYHEVTPLQEPVFANVEVEPWPTSKQESSQVTNGAIAFGTGGIGGGLYLIGTLWLAPYGVLLVVAGVAALCFGLLRKLTSRLWR